MYVRNDVKYISRPDLHHSSLETVWVEVILEHAKNVLYCAVYRPPDQTEFYDLFEESIVRLRIWSSIFSETGTPTCLERMHPYSRPSLGSETNKASLSSLSNPPG